MFKWKEFKALINVNLLNHRQIKQRLTYQRYTHLNTHLINLS